MAEGTAEADPVLEELDPGWNCLHAGKVRTKSTLGAGDDKTMGSTHIFLCCFQFMVQQGII